MASNLPAALAHNRTAQKEGRSDSLKTICHLCLMASEGCPLTYTTGNWPWGQCFNYICKETQGYKEIQRTRNLEMIAISKKSDISLFEAADNTADCF